MATKATGPDNDARPIRADALILDAARALTQRELARLIASQASCEDRCHAARRIRVLLRTFPSAFASGRARSVRALARTARLGVALHPAAAARIAATCSDCAEPLPSDPQSAPSARRASRRAIARALRKIARRGRKLSARSGRMQWLELHEPLRTAVDLSELFQGVTAPEIEGFLDHARDLDEHLARLAVDADRAPDEALLAAWRTFRKRRILRLAVPDL